MKEEMIGDFGTALADAIANGAVIEDKCPAIERQERIDFLKKLSQNAYALNLKRAYRNIMVALGGRMMERDFGRPYQREIVD